MPILNEKFDAINHTVCEMKAMLGLITWLDCCGEAQAQHGSIMVMQHTLLRHVLDIEAQLQDTERQQ